MRPKPLMATRVGMEAPCVVEGGATTVWRRSAPAIRALCAFAVSNSPPRETGPEERSDGRALDSDQERRDDQRHDEDRAREHDHEDGQILGEVARAARAAVRIGGGVHGGLLADVRTSTSLGVPEWATKRCNYAIESVETCRSRRRSACAAREEVTILAAEDGRHGRSGMVLGGQGAPVRARAQVSEDGEDLELHAP